MWSKMSSIKTHRAVKAGFVAQGTSLNDWCKRNSICRPTADKALKGERKSKKSIEILKAAKLAAKVT